MKSPFKKLRDLAVSKHGLKEKLPGASWELEEESQDVAKGMQEVEDMHIQYEGLVTNAQIISGAAFDFSRSLQEMASHMVETYGQTIDGEIGNVFSMLAKVQFEISKLLDLFAAHVSQAIIAPTEMMLKDIQQIQVMKEQYDEKRQAYNLLQKEKQKGKSRNPKGDLPEQQPATNAKEVFIQHANNLCIQMQSLIQQRSHSLITQAARYHAAQMHLFTKGLGSVNAVEPVMRQLALQRNIDRSLSKNDDESLNELHTDAATNTVESESVVSSPGEAPKLENASTSVLFSPSVPHHKEGLQHVHDLSIESHGNKVSMYALPSPVGASGKGVSDSPGLTSQAHISKQTISSQQLGKGGHVGEKAELDKSNGIGMYHDVKRTPKVALEPLNDGGLVSGPTFGRTYSHSGPVANSIFTNTKLKTTKNNATSLFQNNHTSPLYSSGPLSKSPMPLTSQNASLPLLSPPQISELHKLPPPPNSLSKAPALASQVTYSAPLAKKVEETSTPFVSGPPSPLPPPPPGLVTRSLSTPSSSKHLHPSQQESFRSPVLKPMNLSAATSMLR